MKNPKTAFFSVPAEQILSKLGGIVPYIELQDFMQKNWNRLDKLLPQLPWKQKKGGVSDYLEGATSAIACNSNKDAGPSEILSHCSLSPLTAPAPLIAPWGDNV